MKVKICIFNEDVCISDEVFIISEISATPTKGSSIYLCESDQVKLASLICKDHDTAYMYNVYYGKHRLATEDVEWADFIKIPLEELKEIVSLSDFHYVDQVVFEWSGTEYQLAVCLSCSLSEPEY